MIYNITDDGVNIAWAAENEGYNLTPDKPLIVLIAKCVAPSESLNNSIQITSESILADIDANLINTEKLAIPEIVLSAQCSVPSFTCYPNPFNNITNVNYTLPEVQMLI